ncbi:DUF2278 family protein [Larkinella terrae]|uniref:DUF2278 family protein n=1 Tax=Larkinella terrae TaxID=2025311 RepID=A0A7K0ELL5_9BACT|nr:DUF2278 family protein [Larkinella terrae]MRS62709.1 DUF2278 family protein [Larkinella terrae]
MIPPSPQRPLPLGEFLEQLRLDGFAVTPDVYDRCFRIADAYFPNGLNKGADATQLRELRELLGPVVARSENEQDQFGTIFNRFFSGQISAAEMPEGKPISPITPKLTSRLFQYLGASLAIVALIVGLYLANSQHPKKDEGGRPDDSTTTQPTDQNCVLNVSVQSIAGNTVTFINRSPGLKQGYPYRWNFGDSTELVNSTDSVVSHTFSPLNESSVTTIGLREKGCNQTVRLTNFSTSHHRTYPSFPLIKAKPVVRTVYLLNYWYLLAFVLLGSGVVGLMLYRYFFSDQKIEPSSGPPYSLTFPDQEKNIKVTDSMDVWARQLNQRDEGQRQIMDISRTIRATARMGGYPSIYYQQIKVRPRYLVLIDSRSTFHQQARLYTYLSKVLVADEVELETYFFNTDPRTCWNEKYPKGLPLGDLYRFHRDSYLVLITDGIRLIDYSNGTLSAWVSNLLGNWENRALLTPVYPENWTYIEAILTQFFIVLPATPDGQLLLRDYFQLGELPTFKELRQRFQVNPDAVPDRGFFGKSAEQLKEVDINSFLENPFDTEKLSEQEVNRLKQWAYATAVYPTPTWEMTLSIGKAIEQYYRTDALVTTTNLLKITALPWLQQSKIPDQLRQQMLQRFQEFPPELKSRIQNEVLALLDSVKTRPGSLAEEERQLHTYQVMLTDEKQRQAGLRNLDAYQKAGLIRDKVTDGAVSTHRRQRSLAYLLSLGIVAVLLYLLGTQTPAGKEGTPLAALGKLLYSRSDSTVSDSALFYNNLAASLPLESLKNPDSLTRIRRIGESLGYQFQRPLPNQLPTQSGYSIPVNQSELYSLKLVFLRASLRIRNSFEALYNLHALRYERSSIVQKGSDEESILDSIARKIVAPTSWYSAPGFFPKDSSVIAFLKLLNQNQAPDSLLKQLDLLDSYGAHMRYGNQYKDGIVGVRTQQAINRTKQELETAQTSARFNRVVLYLPEAPRTKSVLTLPLPRLNLSANQTDSLAQLDAAWIRFVLEGTTSTTVTSEPPVPETAAGIPGEYGVLVGELTQYQTIGNKLYLLVEAGSQSYRVFIGQESTQSEPNAAIRQEPYKKSKSGFSMAKPNSFDSPVFAFAEGQILSKLDSYQKVRGRKPGFYSLTKTPDAGALDYLQAGGLYQQFKVDRNRNIDDVSTYITNGGYLPIRIYVWGARWKPQTTDPYFKLGRDFYEINYVHQNQGSPETSSNRNAPWQDGGVIVEASPKNPQTLKAVALRFSSQSTSVDKKGNPTSGSTGAAF